MESSKHKILEINLISAQGLKPPSKNTRKMQTYALAWIDSSTKLRTQIDRIGGDNPTWNDKFLFRVTPQFLASETSGISVEIYAVSYVRDPLIGTVRFLISNLLPSSSPSSDHDHDGIMTPFFTAFQIRRPSGSFNGVLNVGAMVINNPEFDAVMSDVSAVGYRDLMGNRRRGNDGIRKVKSMDFQVFMDNNSVNGDGDGDGVESGNTSDGGDSISSNSSSTTSTALKSWNGFRDFVGNSSINNHVRSSSDGGGMLSCFIKQRKPPRLRPSPSDPNLAAAVAAAVGPDENTK
ncbi:hypothetical protein ACFE04_026357 [Oxalis oulophora]